MLGVTFRRINFPIVLISRKYNIFTNTYGLWIPALCKVQSIPNEIKEKYTYIHTYIHTYIYIYICMYISKIESSAITWDWEPLPNECARGVRAATVKTRLARRPWHPACDKDRRRRPNRALFHAILATYLENGTRNEHRCVSIIATFILSFPLSPPSPSPRNSFFRVISDTWWRRWERGIVQAARVCCTTVCPPSARWIADDGYQEGQDGCF